MRDVRRSAVAGTWYPGTRETLTTAVDGHLANVGETAGACPRAIVAPHAGLMYSGPVAAYAYKLVLNCRYAVVVLVGPSHFVGFRGVAIWPRGAWETPFGRVPVHEELAGVLTRQSKDIHEHDAAHAREHSLEMQLPFVARLLPGVPIVPLVMGYQTRDTAEGLGDAIADALLSEDAPVTPEQVLLVASSDLSHYQDARVASEMDAVVLRHVEAFDPAALMAALEREPGHACGGGPIVSVLRAALRLDASRAKILHYADSGDVSGDKSAVVGYMAAAIW
jgi:AmmeMemoRadiSam system protein B